MATGLFALRPEAIQRLLVTIGVLLAYRLGCQIPIPGLDTDVLARTGSSLRPETVSIFALGVTPIFSVLLVYEFFKLVIPPLSRWEAAEPRRVGGLYLTITIVALLMASFQAHGVTAALYEIPNLIDVPGWTPAIVATLVGGTALLGWLGDRITLQGIGAGFWLVLITPTLIKLPATVAISYELWNRGNVRTDALAAAIVFLVVAVALIAMAGNARYGQPWWRSGPASSAPPEFRVSGADFAGVWPPLLGVLLANLTVVFFSIGGTAANPSAIRHGDAVHLVLIALSIAVFTALQSLGAPRTIQPPNPGAASEPAAAAGGLRPYVIIALTQIAVCVGGAWLTRHLTLPFAIDGSWLIVVVTVATSVLRPDRWTA